MSEVHDYMRAAGCTFEQAKRVIEEDRRNEEIGKIERELDDAVNGFRDRDDFAGFCDWFKEQITPLLAIKLYEEM